MGGLSERIRKLRNDLHLSQEYVANYLGIRRSAVVEIESGKRKVTAEELGKLSELFVIPADELLNGSGAILPEQIFARGFNSLDEDDQREILNLIEFKHALKNRG